MSVVAKIVGLVCIILAGVVVFLFGLNDYVETKRERHNIEYANEYEKVGNSDSHTAGDRE